MRARVLGTTAFSGITEGGAGHFDLGMISARKIRRGETGRKSHKFEKLFALRGWLEYDRAEKGLSE